MSSGEKDEYIIHNDVDDDDHELCKCKRMSWKSAIQKFSFSTELCSRAAGCCNLRQSFSFHKCENFSFFFFCCRCTPLLLLLPAYLAKEWERALLANIRNSDRAELFQFHVAMKLFEQVKVGGRFSISRISKEEILIPQKKTWKSFSYPFYARISEAFWDFLNCSQFLSSSPQTDFCFLTAFFYQPTWQNISWSHWITG